MLTNRQWKMVVGTYGGPIGRVAEDFIPDNDPEDFKRTTQEHYGSFNPSAGQKTGVATSKEVTQSIEAKDNMLYEGYRDFYKPIMSSLDKVTVGTALSLAGGEALGSAGTSLLSAGQEASEKANTNDIEEGIAEPLGTMDMGFDINKALDDALDPNNAALRGTKHKLETEEEYPQGLDNRMYNKKHPYYGTF